MADDIAISVENVSKTYRIWTDPLARLKAPLLGGIARCLPRHSQLGRRVGRKEASYFRDFFALREISFQVRKGESVGIIGRNGSGKSTLLQLIANTLQPTAGDVRVAGRIAALLELGSGFNPEFTGRENIFLNGAVLGLSRSQIEARFDAIAAFADIGDFIDQPVKTYSSGMMMRLAFSVQTAVEPQILIVDEALSVGDAPFVAKCIKRVSDFLRDGGTLLFVSHDIGLVKQLTTRALFLDRGRQMAFGDTAAVGLAYTEATSAAQAAHTDPDRYSAPDATYRLEGVEVSGGEGEPGPNLPAGGAATILIRLTPGTPAPSRLVFSIYNYLGLIVCSGVHELPPANEGQTALVVRLGIPKLRLAPGSYRVNVAVRRDLEIVSWIRHAANFMVTGDTTETFIYREDTTVAFVRS